MALRYVSPSLAMNRLSSSQREHLSLNHSSLVAQNLITAAAMFCDISYHWQLCICSQFRYRSQPCFSRINDGMFLSEVRCHWQPYLQKVPPQWRPYFLAKMASLKEERGRTLTTTSVKPACCSSPTYSRLVRSLPSEASIMPTSNNDVMAGLVLSSDRTFSSSKMAPPAGNKTHN